MENNGIGPGGLSKSTEISAMPNWFAFALGGVVTFLFVYIGIARPAAQEMALLRRQVSTLEQSVWEVAGHRDTASETNSLLETLVQQSHQVTAAAKAFAEIQDLNRQLAAETDRVERALDSVDRLSELQSRLLACSPQLDEAAMVVRKSEQLHDRLVESADTTEFAREAAGELLALEDTLLTRGITPSHSDETLDRLIQINDRLDLAGQNVDEAADRVEGLLTLKDAVIAGTQDLADAVETLEVTNDLADQFHDAAMSFERMRHWMVEVVAMDSLLERAMRTLEPLTELGNLRRLNPELLRHVAREMTVDQQPYLASKSMSVDPAGVDTDSPEPAAESTVSID